MLNRVKLLPLRLLQLCVRPFSGRGLGDVRFLRLMHEGLIKKTTPRKVLIEINGYKMEVNMRMGGIARSLVYDHAYEPLATRLFSQYVGAFTRRCVVDVGANIGYYTLLAARILGDKGKVYAFEPDKGNLSFLKRNLEINRMMNVTVIPDAVSDREGDTILYLSNVEAGEHSLVKVPIRKIDRTEQIHTSTLDSIIGEPVGLIKIDVEGAEIQVLKGSQKIITQYHPVLIVECWEDGLKASGNTIENLFSILCNYGYSQILMIDEFDKKTLAASPKLIRDYFVKHHFSVNLLCSIDEVRP